MAKKIKRSVIKWIKKLAQSDIKRTEALAEDLRKAGLAAIGGGIVGMFLHQGGISTIDAEKLVFLGLIMWVVGIFLTKTNKKDDH
ncbi:hypothetical protein [Piscirickettsia litoralis]|uniref:Permease n=1 Tax=Piscirickettsia litoralis TaxID=1891921 RepID=A0ABX2ZY05_9GAMM|nr:hypothetical protein [Piscirickettsia litoralis]ODN41368.1 hypothetical protein BGC07_16490 [Piscirickettsia litoralis]